MTGDHLLRKLMRRDEDLHVFEHFGKECAEIEFCQLELETSRIRAREHRIEIRRHC